MKGLVSKEESPSRTIIVTKFPGQRKPGIMTGRKVDLMHGLADDDPICLHG
jgi:hypothetical protein